MATEDGAAPWDDHNRRVDVARQDKMWAIRGKSIEAYAKVEAEMCWIFAALAGIDMERAGVIFYAIMNGRTRLQIIEAFLKKRGVKKEYCVKYWIKLSRKVIQPINTTRNNIVHWHSMIHDIGGDGVRSRIEVELHRPNFWDEESVNKSISSDDMIGFIENCRFLLVLLRALLLDIQGSDDPGTRKASQEICRKGLLDPPGEADPLFQAFETIRSQRPSSLP